MTPTATRRGTGSAWYQIRTPFVEDVVLIVAFFLSNQRAFVCLREASGRRLSCPYLSAWQEIQAWFVMAVLVAVFMWRRHLLRAAGTVLLRNWPILLFTAIAAASVAWTIYLPATILRVVVLLGSTAVGLYVGLRFKPEALLTRLAAFAGLLIALSLAAVLFVPEAGISDPSLYGNAWRGVFWHRNYLGSIMAFFSAVYLFRIIAGVENRSARLVVDALGWALAALMVVASRSVTGLLILLVLHFAVAGIVAWEGWKDSLKWTHYLAVVGSVLLLAATLVSQRDPVLSALNRASSIAWRKTLWSYLYENHIRNHLVWGNGFGAIWDFDNFRQRVAELHGWSYPVYMADSGFVDLTLHLGIMGLISLLLILTTALLRARALLVEQRTILSGFPLVAALYVASTNITLSYFVELESFVWIILIAVCAAATNTPSAKPFPQANNRLPRAP